MQKLDTANPIFFITSADDQDESQPKAKEKVPQGAGYGE